MKVLSVALTPLIRISPPAEPPDQVSVSPLARVTENGVAASGGGLVSVGIGGMVMEAWKAVQGVKRVSAEDGTLLILADDSNRVLPRLFESAAANTVRITSVAIQEPNLEAVFLHLTGKALRD